MRILVTPTFVRTVKKLHGQQKTPLDEAIRDVSLLIDLIFTAVSILRSFALRRGFESLRVRQSALPSDGRAENALH